MKFITVENVDRLAAAGYINSIIDEDEFWEDYDRIKYIKRLFNRFRQTKSLKVNLVINHLIIMYNVFHSKELTRILFFKFEGYHDCLKPFLTLMHRLPVQINPYTEAKPILYTSEISDNEDIIQQLRIAVAEK